MFDGLEGVSVGGFTDDYFERQIPSSSGIGIEFVQSRGTHPARDMSLAKAWERHIFVWCLWEPRLVPSPCT